MLASDFRSTCTAHICTGPTQVMPQLEAFMMTMHSMQCWQLLLCQEADTPQVSSAVLTGCKYQRSQCSRTLMKDLNSLLPSMQCTVHCTQAHNIPCSRTTVTLLLPRQWLFITSETYVACDCLGLHGQQLPSCTKGSVCSTTQSNCRGGTTCFRLLELPAWGWCM